MTSHIYKNTNKCHSQTTPSSGLILESKGICAIFQRKDKKGAKKGKIFENFAKNVQNLKIF